MGGAGDAGAAAAPLPVTECTLTDHQSDPARSITIRFRGNVRWDAIKAEVEKNISYRPYYLQTPDRHAFRPFEGTLPPPKDLLCFDKIDGEIRDTSTKVVDVTPHPATLTETGKNEYFDSRFGSGVPFALAELIDNSIDATRHNEVRPRDIEIHIFLNHTGPGDDHVVVWDNGTGMPEEEVRNWATYHLGRNQRRKDDKTLQQERDDEDRYFFDSRISYFGVGGTHAAFFFAESVTVITSPAGSPDVFSMTMSKAEMERRSMEQDGTSYQEKLYKRVRDKRHAGGAGADTGPYETLFEREAKLGKQAGFTAIVLSKQRDSMIADLRDTKRWTETLANIYFFRLHPEYLFCNPGDKKYQKAQDTINISYCVYDGGEALDGGKKSLKDVVSQQMSFYQAAKPERFSFKIVFDEYKDHTSKPAIVRGVIKYHPFEHDRETKPARTQAEQHANEEDITQFGKREIDSTVYDVCWNGRWIPIVEFHTLPFTSDKEPLTNRPKPPKLLACNGEEPNVYKRISGCLFLSVPFEVTQNKMHLTEQLEEICVNKPYKFYLQDPNSGKYILRHKPEVEFVKWLDTMHKKYDREMNFGEPIKKVSINDAVHQSYYGGSVTYTMFRTVTMAIDDLPVKTYEADKIFFQNRTIMPPEIGRVVGFLVEGDHMDKPSLSHASGKSTLFLFLREPAAALGSKEEHEAMGMFKKAIVAKNKRSWFALTKAEFDEACDVHQNYLPSTLRVFAPNEEGGNQQGKSKLPPPPADGNQKKVHVLKLDDQIGPFMVYVCDGFGKPISSMTPAVSNIRIYTEYRELRGVADDGSETWVVLERTVGQKLVGYDSVVAAGAKAYGTWFMAWKEAKGGTRFEMEWGAFNIKTDADNKIKDLWLTKGKKLPERGYEFPNALPADAVIPGCKTVLQWEMKAGPPDKMHLLSVKRRVKAGEEDDAFDNVESDGGRYLVHLGDELQVAVSIRDKEDNAVKFSKKKGIVLHKGRCPHDDGQPHKIKDIKVFGRAKNIGSVHIIGVVEPYKDMFKTRDSPWKGKQKFQVSWSYAETPDDRQDLSLNLDFDVRAGRPHKLELVQDNIVWTSGEPIIWPSVRVLDKFGCVAHNDGSFAFRLERETEDKNEKAKNKDSSKKTWVPQKFDGNTYGRFAVDPQGVPTDPNPFLLSLKSASSLKMRAVLVDKRGDSFDQRGKDLEGVSPVIVHIATELGDVPDGAELLQADGSPLNGATVKAGEVVSGLRLAITSHKGEVPADKICKLGKMIETSWDRKKLPISKQPADLSLELGDWTVPTAQGSTHVTATVKFKPTSPINLLLAKADVTVTAADPHSVSVSIDNSSMQAGKKIPVSIHLADEFNNECDVSSVWDEQGHDLQVSGDGFDLPDNMKWALVDSGRRLTSKEATVSGEVGSNASITVKWLGLSDTANGKVRSGPPEKAERVEEADGDADAHSSSSLSVINGGVIEGGALQLKVLDSRGNPCTEVEGWTMTLYCDGVQFSSGGSSDVKDHLDSVIKKGVADFGMVAVHCLAKEEDTEHAFVATIAEKKGGKPIKLTLHFAVTVKSDPTLPVDMLLCLAEPPLADAGGAGGAVNKASCPATKEPIEVTASTSLPLLRICFFNRDGLAIEAQRISAESLSVTLKQKRLAHNLTPRTLATDAYCFGIGGDDASPIPSSFKLGQANIVAKYTGRNASTSAKGKGKGIENFADECLSDVLIVRGPASGLVARIVNGHEAVSNADEPDARTILGSVQLTVTDKHGNCVQDWDHESVRIDVCDDSSATGGSVPLLEQQGGDAVVKGVLDIKEGLRLRKGTSGVNNEIYKLRIVVTGTDPQNGVSQTFEYATTFRFVDDTAILRQARVVENDLSAVKERIDLLSLEIGKLEARVREERSKHRLTEVQITALSTATGVLMSALAKELQAQNHPPSLSSRGGLQEATKFIGWCKSVAHRGQRRLKGPHPDENPMDKRCEVVGFVANLVAVEDDLYCRILSWHLGSNTKVLVVRDNKTAEKYKRETKVLSLMAARASKMTWPAQVPADAKGFGGEYLLNKVTFRDYCKEEATIALNALVGDVLVFPDLKLALDYRTELRKKNRNCGALYTMKGDKIASSGVTGGKNEVLPELSALPIAFPKSDAIEHKIDKAAHNVESLIELSRQLEDHGRAITEAQAALNAALPKQRSLEELRKEEKQYEEKLRELGLRKHSLGGAHGEANGKSKHARLRSASTSEESAASASHATDDATADVARKASELGWTASSRTKKARHK